MSARRSFRALALVGAISAVVAVTGCGGGGKPGYCADRANLESSIKDLSNLSFSGGLSGLQSQLRTIQSNATKLVDSARDDFASETRAISTSVNALASDVRAIAANPSPAQVAGIASDASAVVRSVTGFMDATSSKCD
ncbi:MAG TPA: hypothetical protein VKB25_08140 [Conexibacter sp.]|nr:hypothetical protein [Conexibacter sp.]